VARLSAREADMDLGLAGKRCVVLGASRGIGRAIAGGLASEGANVGICARNEESLGQAAEELRTLGVHVHAERCDIADVRSLVAFLDGARAALGGIDVLVHNASALAVGPDLAAWDASLHVDLMAAVHACEHVIPWMAEGSGGSILLVSSISGLEASPANDYAYTTVKAALIAYAKKLATAQAERGIRVNAIAPGSVEFPGGFWANVRAMQPALYQRARNSIPAGRMGTPEEIADVAVFLCSPRAGWVTGECVAVDGGQHKAMR
jgi:3-oxoacyl-[acyl-carrier protein] reductase